MGKLSNCSPACRKLYLAAYCRTQGNCGGKLFFSPPRHGADGKALDASKALDCTPKNAEDMIEAVSNGQRAQQYLQGKTKAAWDEYFDSLKRKLNTELDRKPKPNSCTLLGLVTEMMFVNGVLAGAGLGPNGLPDLTTINQSFLDTKTYQVPPNFKGDDGRLDGTLARLNFCKVQGGCVTVQTKEAKVTLQALNAAAERGGPNAQAKMIEEWHHAAWEAYFGFSNKKFDEARRAAYQHGKLPTSCHGLDLLQEFLCIHLIVGGDPSGYMAEAARLIGKLPAWKVVEGPQEAGGFRAPVMPADGGAADFISFDG